MNYEEIKKHKDSYKITENEYICPICKIHKTTKGFLQHVKNHFIKRNLTNFYKAGKVSCKNLHKIAIEKYNKNPNKCKYCQKEILAKENDNIGSIKEKIFCDRSCSSKYNNSGRLKSEITKEKISNSLKNKNLDKICLQCQIKFHAKNIKNLFCSRNCSHKYKFGDDFLTKEKLIEEINNFVITNGYVPTSKMNPCWMSMSKSYFGSWNNMIKSLGHEPHNQKYGKGSYKCKDGDIADSISEMIVDNWLYENRIDHERRKKYHNSKRNCDFWTIKDGNEFWIEYFGLAGEDEQYDIAIEEKRKISKDNNLNLIEIYHYDLYPVNMLSEKLNLLI